MPDDLVYSTAQMQRMAEAAASEIERLRSELSGANVRIDAIKTQLAQAKTQIDVLSAAMDTARAEAARPWLLITQPDIPALADFILALEPRALAQVLARVAVRLEAIEPTGLVT
jgi:hypothetical protein